jgi:hypothetical protein
MDNKDSVAYSIVLMIGVTDEKVPDDGILMYRNA